MTFHRAITLVTRRLAGMAVVLLISTTASAQIGSGISGVVRDASGAVMPGVTVEAASPVLIEGSRSTITDSSGQYQIIDLRPGSYTVTFTLTGFRTVRREGIILTAAFTATVNTELQVGQLEESITV
ncbi:MAG: carboxypeptidase-like regulatory domain-containing protein, partial [Vicinamibacterales bacterium]